MKSCTACPFYLTCRTPCRPVEDYANQDHRHGREIPLSQYERRDGSPFIDAISSTVVITAPSNGEVILTLYFTRHWKMADIAREVQVSHAYVSKVVSEAKAKILEAIESSRPRRGRPRKETR